MSRDVGATQVNNNVLMYPLKGTNGGATGTTNVNTKRVDTVYSNHPQVRSAENPCKLTKYYIPVINLLILSALN